MVAIFNWESYYFHAHPRIFRFEFFVYVFGLVTISAMRILLCVSVAEQIDLSSKACGYIFEIYTYMG